MAIHPPRSLLARAPLLLGLLIVALAFALRVAPITAGLPYLRYVDEGHLLHDAIAVLQRGTFDTGFYNYPALPSYMIAGALCLYAPIYSQTHGANFWSELQRGEEASYYDYFAPPGVIVVGRMVVLLFSVGTVVLAGIFGNALGGRRTGLLAMLLVAVCPALVSRGSILIVDTIATFFAMASLCFAQRLYLQAAKGSAELWRFAIGAAVAAGLAFVSKYTAGAIVAAGLTTILLVRRSVLHKAGLILLSGIVFVATSVVAMPTLVTSTGRIVVTIRAVARFYDLFPTGPGYLAAATLSGEVGVPLLIAGSLGIALMLWHRPSRALAIGWLAVAVVLVAGLGWKNFQPFRNFLPLVPAICIGAAFFLTRLRTLPGGSGRQEIIERWIAPGAALALLLSLGIPMSKDLKRQCTVVDSRVRAVDWLGQRAHATDRILAIRELAIHPAEWKRIGREATTVSWFEAADLLERERFDRVIESDFDLRFGADAKAWSEYHDRWQARMTAFRVQKSFGSIPCFIEPGVWRTNDERIVIRRSRSE